MIVHRLKEYVDPNLGGGVIAMCGEYITDGRQFRGMWNHWRKKDCGINCEKCLALKPEVKSTKGET